MRPKLILFQKNKENSSNKNHHHVVMLLLSTMGIVFLLENNASFFFLRWVSLRQFFFTITINFGNIGRPYFYLFNV